MKKVIGCIVAFGIFCCVGCASVTKAKVGPVALDVRTEAHKWKGVKVNPKNGERSLTVGFVTVGGDGRIEKVAPNVLDFGFAVTIPEGTKDSVNE